MERLDPASTVILVVDVQAELRVDVLDERQAVDDRLPRVAVLIADEVHVLQERTQPTQNDRADDRRRSARPEA